MCEIVFRLSGSGQRVSRRFLKDDTVQVSAALYSKLLYDFIESREDVELEGEEGFEIVSPVPPVNVLRPSDHTLEPEGLHPRALLQIREIGS